MAQQLANKVALVTGAGKGMGAAIARAFVDEGARVGVMDNHTEAATATAEEIGARDGKAIAIHGDVRHADSVKEAIDAVAREFGGLDIVVNNAGVSVVQSLPDMTEEEWDFVMDINLKAMFHTCKFGIPLMRQRGGGAIVNIASVQAYYSGTGAVAYTASKGGVVAFTRALALDHAREGIRVNAIAPGSVRTPMLWAAAEALVPENPDDAMEIFAKGHPIGRVIEPEEIANVAVFLASDKAPALTGATILVDGAISAGTGSW
jgi:NAD(P)-dependent dehydrogenase (short-subunit alcohol dehydrogenase family)